MSKKVHLTLDDQAVETMEQLQKASGHASMAEVFEKALGFYNWAYKQHQKGFAIGTIKDGEAIREVIFDFR